MNSRCSVYFDLGWISRHRMFLYGAATLWIVMYHCLTRAGGDFMLGIPAWIQKHGMCGVEMFLLLSGFGLYRSMSSNPDIKRFYARRLSRVYMPAFIVAAVYCAVNYMSLQDTLYAISMFAYFFNTRSFWYVAFILIMYAIYPAIYALQRRSVKGAWLVCAAVSAAVMGIVMVTDCAAHLQRAVTRVPVFLLGCLIAPWIIEGKKIPAWSVAAVVGGFVVMEAGRLAVSPESYVLRGAAFIMLACSVLMLLAYAAEAISRFGKGRGLYRCMAFMGSISLETYLIFERVQNMMLKIRGYEAPARTDLVKIDLTAFIVTVILGYLLTIFCGMLRRDFAAIKIPGNDTN